MSKKKRLFRKIDKETARYSSFSPEIGCKKNRFRGGKRESNKSTSDILEALFGNSKK